MKRNSGAKREELGPMCRFMFFVHRSSKIILPTSNRANQSEWWENQITQGKQPVHLQGDTLGMLL